MNKRVRNKIAALALAAGPLVTTATCDPYTGTVALFRDDDLEYYDGGYYYEEVVFYEDCYYFVCF